MKKLIDLWKIFAKESPRLYLYTCWILIGLIGNMLGFGVELTAAFVLLIGYFINVIWMMRQSK